MVRLKIGVIGAGIGGLALAALLERRGHDVALFEQSASFSRVGAGIQIGANAMKALRGLGLEAAIRRVGFRPESLLNVDYDSGNVTNELPGGDKLEARYGAPHMCLHRADMHGQLLVAVPPAIIHLGHKLIGIAPSADGVRLHFQDREDRTVDALIGADGVHSVVRTELLGPDQPQFTGRVAYRTTFSASLLGSEQLNQSRTKWWGPDRHIVIYYVTAACDEVYFVTSQPEDPNWLTPESWSSKGDIGELRQAFAAFHPYVQRVLTACPEVHKWALLSRAPLSAWAFGRCVLLGDACHPMAPYMAQGAAMALEDAVMLARCLDGVERSGIDAAFRRYEANRKPRATSVQSLSNENTFLRRPGGTDWVYGYDVWSAPLDVPGPTQSAA